MEDLDIIDVVVVFEDEGGQEWMVESCQHDSLSMQVDGNTLSPV